MTNEEQMIQDVLNGKTDSFRWIIDQSAECGREAVDIAWPK